MNKKSIFNIKNILRNIFLVFFLFIFSITLIQKSEASIYISTNDIPGLENSNHTGVDILYDNGYKMAWDTGDKEPQNSSSEKLSDAEIAKVNSYLSKKSTEALNDFNSIINRLINTLNTRPDVIPVCHKPTTTFHIFNCGNYDLPAPNSTLIQKTKESPNFNKLIQTIKLSPNTFYGTSGNGLWKEAFNWYAKDKDWQFEYNIEKNGVLEIACSEFEKCVEGNEKISLPLYILNKYLLKLQLDIKNATNTSTSTNVGDEQVNKIIENLISKTTYTDIKAGKVTIGARGLSWNDEVILDYGDLTKNINNLDLNNPNQDLTNAAQQAGTDGTASSGSCTATKFFSILSTDDTVVGNPNCSIIAYMINGFINMLNRMLGYVNELVGEVFGWVFNMTVVDFSDWVSQSNAITIYKTILLSLITSLVLPLVFYLIIRMLIDNNTSNIEKILPKVLFMALFVYFSFGITGWIIDQSNIISIYLYRSMTHVQNGEVQSIGEVMQRALLLQSGHDVAQGAASELASPDTIAYTLGQLIINIVALFVIIQAMTLIFVRGIILLMSMILSPLMFMPAGIGGSVGKFIDEWREKLITYFTGNLLLGPIFMMLLFIALKVAGVGTELTTSAPNISLPGAPAGQNFLSGIITTILVVVLLQTAITVAKKMSGSLGGEISGKINSFVAGNAMRLGGSAGRRLIGGTAEKALQGEGVIGKWMKKNEGTRMGKFANSNLKKLSTSTFDLRNSENVQKAMGLAGGNMSDYGKASNKTGEERYKKTLYEAKKYHNSLGEEGKRNNIERLKSKSGDKIYGGYSERIAKELEKNPKNSLKEKMDQDPEFNKKFNEANDTSDKEKRNKEIEKTINEHFKDNKFGEKYFSEALKKPENNDLKEKYQKALDEKDDKKRKNSLVNLVDEFEKQNKSKEKEIKEEIRKKEEIEERIKINNGFNSTSTGNNGYTYNEQKNNTNNNINNKIVENQTEEIKRQTENFSRGISSLGDKLDKLTDVIRTSRQENERFTRGFQAGGDIGEEKNNKTERRISAEENNSGEDAKRSTTVVQGFRRG